MALVALRDLSDLSGTPLEIARSGEAQYGQLLNTWRALMNAPDLFAAYLPFLRRVAGPGSLDQRIKEMSAVLVANLNHCRYTTSHRAASAKKAGVSEQDLQRVVRFEWDEFDERTTVALALTRELTTEPSRTPYSDAPTSVDSALTVRARDLFDDAQLVELLMSISMWNALSRFHRVMGFELDMPPAPTGVVPD